MKFEDGQILFYIYNGTSDYAIPMLRDTQDEAWDYFWKHRGFAEAWKECLCAPETREPVEIVSDYGGGFWWQGLACRKCKVIIGSLTPLDDEATTDGYPDWSPFNPAVP